METWLFSFLGMDFVRSKLDKIVITVRCDMRKTFQIVLLGMACFMFAGCDGGLAVLNLGSKFTHEVGDDVGSMAIKEGTLTEKMGIGIRLYHAKK